jgi:hypothetical protein
MGILNVWKKFVAERHYGRERGMKSAIFEKGNIITRRRSESGERKEEKCDQLLTTGCDRKGGNDRNEKAHKELKEVYLARQEIHYYHHECCGRRERKEHESLLMRNQEQTTIALLLLLYIVMQSQSKLSKQSMFSAFNSDIDLPIRSP